MAKYAIAYDRKLAAKVRKAIRAGLKVECHSLANGECDVFAYPPSEPGTPRGFGKLLGVTMDAKLAREWESMSRCYGTNAQFGV